MTYTRVNWQDGSGGGTPIDAANLNVMDAGIAAAVPLDGSAPMTGPIQLAAGHQETGPVGAEGIGATGAGGTGAVTGYLKGFRAVMTHVPSSITLSATATANVDPTYPRVDTITAYGFNFNLGANSAGLYYWHGTYTTVGNCLLAVNMASKTFNHHCDACQAVHTSRALSALVTAQQPWGAVVLFVVCPNCGASEYFDTRVTAADEQDETPQGSGEYTTTRGAQARLIRQLLTLLELPVA